MDLHGNAALSWSGRRKLVRRVVDQVWGAKTRCALQEISDLQAGR